MTKTVAYLRVSTDKQDLEKNRGDVLAFANARNMGQVHFVEDTVSGTVDWRKRKLGQVLEQLGPGDNLIVPELSRLGRSMLGILEVLREVKEREVNLFAVKEGYTLDDSIQGTVLVGVFSMLAEVERKLISARTKEALAAKRREGVILGRKSIKRGGKRSSRLDKSEVEIVALLRQGSTLTFVAGRYGVSPQSLYRWCERRGIDRKALAAEGLTQGK